MENTALQLSDLKISNLPELQGWKEKQEQLVADNPYVEITDNKTYEAACKSRTALVKGKTELKKQDKLIASKLASFRKDVKTETDALIAITLPFEEKQQVEVKRYEGIKESEKLERDRIEKERVDTIKAKIDVFESDSYRMIQETNIGNVSLHKTMLDALVNIEFDYEEFDILFEQARSRVQLSWDLKCNDIQEKEEQRLENERLQKEYDESKRVAELQATRLKELLPYAKFIVDVDLTSLSNLSDLEYRTILGEVTALYESDAKTNQEAQDKCDAEKLERENKAKADKENIFEIRKGRFLELGVELNGEYFMNTTGIVCDKRDVFNADAIDFETIITDAKLAIKEAIEEQERSNQQKEADLELSKADAERLKKENKEREKRLFLDKKVIAESFIGYFTDLHLETDNEEIINFIESANVRIHNLEKELLTELEKL